MQVDSKVKETAKKKKQDCQAVAIAETKLLNARFSLARRVADTAQMADGGVGRGRGVCVVSGESGTRERIEDAKESEFRTGANGYTRESEIGNYYTRLV